MDISTATIRLSALAQETRLTIFRALVQAGPEGLNPGGLADELGIAQATLSFHLKELRTAGLIRARQESRFIYYSADFQVMRELLGYLTENCCGSKSTCKPNRPTKEQPT
jgi:ArsR family transcriptional regulator